VVSNSNTKGQEGEADISYKIKYNFPVLQMWLYRDAAEKHP